jgi:hypothetical protein
MAKAINTFIAEEHLDFAIRHISNFYDTDFFPRTEEFLALSHSWKDVKKHILESDLDSLMHAAPIVAAWPKVRGGYRVVHRLEPLDALLYTAMAKAILPAAEKSRVSSNVACSYRLSDGWDSFFGDGSGFDVFRSQCNELSQKFSHVLCADISDFYNKIYLHRLQNAVQLAMDKPEGISNQIEKFLLKLNTKASQGIPIGPAASILLSEVTLNDVDKFLIGKEFAHVRYVDDFRIFGHSEASLQTLLQSLTLYLHESHRLSLNPEKTYIIRTDEFVNKDLNNQYTQEKLHILDDIEGVNPYAFDETDDYEEFNDDLGEPGRVLHDAMGKLLSFTALDLGLARGIIRRAKAYRIDALVPLVLDNIEFLSPVVNDVVLYLEALASGEDLFELFGEELIDVCGSPAMNILVVRMWFEWLFSRHRVFLQNGKIRAFVFSSFRLRPQAQAAITLKSEAWVKERKTTLMHHAGSDTRSILFAATLLSKDERENWLNPIIKAGSLGPVGNWMAKWVMDGSPVNVHPFPNPF